MTRETTRRKVIKSGIVTGTPLLLAGCSSSQQTNTTGQGGAEGTTAQTGGGTEKTTLSYHDRHEFGFESKFEESHPNIDLTTTIQAPSSNYKGLVSEVAAGNAPDVIGLGVTILGRFAELGALANLESFVDSLDYTNDFFQVMREEFMTYNGQTVALPFWIDNSVYYYNKKHFEEAGLDPENPPETWEEFRAAGKALTTDGRKGIGMSFFGGMANFFWLPYVWSNGGALLNDDRTEARLNEPEAVEALEYWIDIVNKGYTNDVITTKWTDLHQKFVNEEVSILHSGGFAIGYVQDKNPELYENMGNALIPKPEGGSHSSFIGGNAITISKQAKEDPQKFQAAKEFVQWVNTDVGMQTIFEKGYFPGRQSAFDLEIAQNNARLLNTFRDALSSGTMPPVIPEIFEVNSPFRANVKQAIQGNKAPEKALSDAADQINNIL